MTIAPPLGAMSAGDLAGLIGSSTIFGKLILLLLFVISVLSWAVMFDKARRLASIRQGHVTFWERCHAWLEGRETWAELRQWCRQQRRLPLARLLSELDGATSIPTVRRISERVTYAEVESLERYLMLLSTAVTIAPFLGLLGTVWGIMTAFWDMQALRSANLLVVAPGIAEALITTVAGLATAIPAVVFYNLFVRKIDLVANEMERLRSLVEDELAVQAAGQTGVVANQQAHPVETRRPPTHEKERIR